MRHRKLNNIEYIETEGVNEFEGGFWKCWGELIKELLLEGTKGVWDCNNDFIQDLYSELRLFPFILFFVLWSFIFTFGIIIITLFLLFITIIYPLGYVIYKIQQSKFWNRITNFNFKSLIYKEENND